MKSLLSGLARLACLPLFLLAAVPWARASGEPTQESLATIGVTSVGGGQTWAYLAWMTNSQDLLDARTFAIYSKSGPADFSGSYARVAIAQVQTDALAISALIDRAATGLGENTVDMDEMVRGLFKDLMPSAAITTADRVSAVVRGALGDPTHLKNLMIAAKTYPSLSMVLGRAHALPIPASGPVTFEVREFDAASGTDRTVVGRVTVDGSTPLGIVGSLQAPTALIEPPLNPAMGKNDLAIRFVWDTPDAFRALALMTHGFNLYRVRRAFAEQNGLHNSAPGGAVLGGLAASAPNDVQRVNKAPITPDRALTVGELAAVTYDTRFYVDDVTHMPGYPTSHTVPRNGDQYYYYVTPRDILGRDAYSDSSPGHLGTFCSRMPPRTPHRVRVVNDYKYDGNAGVQRLKVRWLANPDEPTKRTVRYLVYRWENPSDVYTLGGNPVANFIGSVERGEPMEFLDAALGTAGNLDKTFWYTVRAVDDGSYDPDGGAGPDGPYCDVAPFGGNLSGHSGPVFGVLRSREAMKVPTSTITFLCPDPVLNVNGQVTTATDLNVSLGAYHLRLETARVLPDPMIQYVEYYYTPSGGAAQFLGRTYFSDGDPVLVQQVDVPLDMPAAGNRIQARIGLKNGKISALVSLLFNRPGTPLCHIDAKYIASVNYVQVVHDAENGDADCDLGDDVDPQFIPPGLIPWPKITLHLPPGAREWKAFYRMDGGELTLLNEGAGDFTADPNVDLFLNLYPAAQTELCLYSQVFDLHGNPSPLKLEMCLPKDGSQPLPVPMLGDVVPGGTEASPTGTLQWFCPPYGVHHFEVWASAVPERVPDDWDGPGSALLKVNTTFPEPNAVHEAGDAAGVTRDYKVFDTERVGPLFGGSEASFALNVLAKQGARWHLKVRAVADSGAVGAFSNQIEFEWSKTLTTLGPDVPWPTRPLPDAKPQFLAGQLVTKWLKDEGCVGIRVGKVHGLFTTYQSAYKYVFGNIGDLDQYLFIDKPATSDARTILPVVVYRVQEDEGDDSVDFPSSRDMVQVSPLLERIADGDTVISGVTKRVLVDPFFAAEQEEISGGVVSWLYIKDTQPVIVGCKYRYLLTLLNPETKEVVGVVPTVPLLITQPVP